MITSKKNKCCVNFYEATIQGQSIKPHCYKMQLFAFE